MHLKASVEDITKKKGESQEMSNATLWSDKDLEVVRSSVNNSLSLTETQKSLSKHYSLEDIAKKKLELIRNGSGAKKVIIVKKNPEIKSQVKKESEETKNYTVKEVIDILTFNKFKDVSTFKFCHLRGGRNLYLVATNSLKAMTQRTTALINGHKIKLYPLTKSEFNQVLDKIREGAKVSLNSLAEVDLSKTKDYYKKKVRIVDPNSDTQVYSIVDIINLMEPKKKSRKELHLRYYYIRKILEMQNKLLKEDGTLFARLSDTELQELILYADKCIKNHGLIELSLTGELKADFNTVLAEYRKVKKAESNLQTYHITVKELAYVLFKIESLKDKNSLILCRGISKTRKMLKLLNIPTTKAGFCNLQWVTVSELDITYIHKLLGCKIFRGKYDSDVRNEIEWSYLKKVQENAKEKSEAKAEETVTSEVSKVTIETQESTEKSQPSVTITTEDINRSSDWVAPLIIALILSAMLFIGVFIGTLIH